MTLVADRLGARIGGPPARWLFCGLELTVAPGEVWALVGPNGSGKSTLLRCLAGLRPPDEGEVRWGARRWGAMPSRERATRVAYLPQRTPLYHDLEARQLVMLGRAPHLSRWRSPTDRDAQHVDRALARVQVSHLASRRISTLSGGERQRVMLARLLATEAPLLLLDEPTTALDIGHALRLLALCRELAGEGTAVVLAMHELDLARRYSDRAVCLGAGDRGEHHQGPTDHVLTPERLGEVFEVDVRAHPEGLSFRPRDP